ncbi:hypothetical protein GY45DRAFT_867200 [Cubamyces sp. BRFM 1775]|nr:hypothetical protein GY45DRAFT_867200 [Cubamyces sp. BRFM 1775]
MKSGRRARRVLPRSLGRAACGVLYRAHPALSTSLSSPGRKESAHAKLRLKRAEAHVNIILMSTCQQLSESSRVDGAGGVGWGSRRGRGRGRTRVNRQSLSWSANSGFSVLRFSLIAPQIARSSPVALASRRASPELEQSGRKRAPLAGTPTKPPGHPCGAEPRHRRFVSAPSGRLLWGIRRGVRTRRPGPWEGLIWATCPLNAFASEIIDSSSEPSLQVACLHVCFMFVPGRPPESSERA